MIIWRIIGEAKKCREESIAEFCQKVIDKNVLFSCIFDIYGLS